MPNTKKGRRGRKSNQGQERNSMGQFTSNDNDNRGGNRGGSNSDDGRKNKGESR